MKTTDEMDSIISPEDIKNKDRVYSQCANCLEWDTRTLLENDFKCSHCGSHKFNQRETVSVRTFNPKIHNKKKKSK